MLRLWLTGGAGFIGTNLLRFLTNNGSPVQTLVLDNLSNTGLKKPGEWFRQRGIRFESVDLGGECPGTVLDKWAREFPPDCIIHLAAVSGVSACEQDLAGAARSNIQAFYDLIRIWQGRQATGENCHFIFASSAAVYGETTQGNPVPETMRGEPLSVYGLQKEFVEKNLRILSQRQKGPPAWTIFRFFNVYGPGQSPNSPYSGVISKFLKNHQKGRPLSVHGDGSQSRDFVFVEDVARALEQALNNPDAWAGQTVNLGSGHPTSVLELARLVQGFETRQTGELNLEFGPGRPGDIPWSLADISRARTLGWTPRWSLKAGLAETRDWFERK